MTQRDVWIARSQLSRTYVSLALACTLTGCAQAGLNTGGTPTAFALAVRSATDNTKNHPSNTPFSVNAACPAGQQLLGGGYRLINNTNAFPTMVAVEGNYPSARDTWTIQVRNPDANRYTGDADVVVMALAYCLTTPNYDVQTTIETRSWSLPKSPTTGTTTRFDVRCQTTSALALSGGFKTTSLPPFNDPSRSDDWGGLLGSGIVQTGPSFADATNSATGWHVDQAYAPAFDATVPKPDVTTSVYALCAQKSIVDQAHRLVTKSGTLTGSSSFDAACDPGEFTVSGGYALTAGLPTGASAIHDDLALHSPFSFTQWEVSGSAVSSPIAVSAYCIRIPTI